MYRKELCSVLLKDPDQNESSAGEEKEKGTRKLKWHKVLWTIKDLDRKWLLLQKPLSSLD
ncbi:hypothetical protein MKW94_025184, partial [Papaver nudicaule]|nr:hypothetical protein [Papaver nudicaule]MCL7025154.1 hypothetical protein [Papaver nudicaule]MCL7046070.1 hypothetical protein [Papaver nudicaule]